VGEITEPGGRFQPKRQGEFAEMRSGNARFDGHIKSGNRTIRDGGGGWVRTYGNTGWFNQDHGGGWHMTDSTWIRAYNNKKVYTNNEIRGNHLRSTGGAHIDANLNVNDVFLRKTGVWVSSLGQQGCGSMAAKWGKNDFCSSAYNNPLPGASHGTRTSRTDSGGSHVGYAGFICLSGHWVIEDADCQQNN